MGCVILCKLVSSGCSGIVYRLRGVRRNRAASSRIRREVVIGWQIMQRIMPGMFHQKSSDPHVGQAGGCSTSVASIANSFSGSGVSIGSAWSVVGSISGCGGIGGVVADAKFWCVCIHAGGHLARDGTRSTSLLSLLAL